MRERTWTLVGCRQREKRARVPVGRGTRRDVGDVARVGSLLEHFAPLDDDGARRRRSASGSTIQIEGRLDDQRLAERVVTAEPLDRATVELALRIVAVEWWAGPWGTTPLTLLSRTRGELADRWAVLPMLDFPRGAYGFSASG